MSAKLYRLRVRGRQHYPDTAEPGDISFKTQASILLRGDTELISYLDASDPENPARVTVKVTPQETVYSRDQGRTRLVFRENESTRGALSTAYGVLELEIFTQQIHFHRQAAGGRRLVLHYSLTSNGQLLSHNKLSLTAVPVWDGPETESE